jgi:hypothetical protein
MDFSTYLTDPDWFTTPEALEILLTDTDEVQQIKIQTEEKMIARAYYMTLFCSSFPSYGIEMLEKQYNIFPNAKDDFLSFVETTLEVYQTYEPFISSPTILNDPKFLIVKRHVNEWIEDKREALKEEKPKQPFEKIKWNGSPAVFGYLFLELVKKGFITPPLFNGEPNFTALSRLCFEYFEIDTTPENLTKALNEKSNPLSNTKRAKFTIPERSDLK